MNESEQAQAIAEIKGRRVNRMNIAALNDGNTAESDLFAALEIVDSQAQKSEKLLAENNVLAILVDELKADREAQAKEIERLKKILCDDLHYWNAFRTADGKGACKMNIEKHRAFIESLDGEKGLPEEMHGWHFDGDIDEQLKHSRRIGDTSGDFLAYLIERCHRAESRQIPDLKEQVKELMRDAMNLVSKFHTQVINGPENGDKIEDLRDKYSAFRALCEPEKDSKEVKP